MYILARHYPDVVENEARHGLLRATTVAPRSPRSRLRIGDPSIMKKTGGLYSFWRLAEE